MKNVRKLLCLLMALAMVLSLAACGGNGGGGGSDTPVEVDASADTDNGDGTFYNSAAKYTYGSTFRSDEPVTYTMYFNDNDAYPIQDSWKTDGIFAQITKMTNVTLDITVVNNSSYGERVSLAISSGTAPYIIPKMYEYSENAFYTGGGIVAVSDYTQYMPNYTDMVQKYDLQTEVNQHAKNDGKLYRLPGLKESALQDYTFVIRDDIFKAAGYDVRELEKDWTWDEFIDILVDVKAYMVSQGMCSASDYIWSDRWCGADSGYGTGGNLVQLIAETYGVHSTWTAGNLTNYADLYFDWDADEFKITATSDEFKQYIRVVQRLVSEGILDPETWTQNDDVADGKFYRGETALMSTNRAQYTVQQAGLQSQLGADGFETYMVVIPKGTTDYQKENSRLECGLCISSSARNELSDDEFVKMMRFVDWLFYSEEALTMTKWGVEGETYQVNSDGTYSLLPQYYCNGLSIAQTSDDQSDMRMNLGYAGGNFMYSGSRELLTSNFSAELQDYYSRMAEYRTLRPLDPPIALSEDDGEMMSLWATPLKGELDKWILLFAMGQKDVDADWDEYVAAIEAQNAQNVIDLYNQYYQNSK